MRYTLVLFLLLGSINLHAAKPDESFKCEKVAQSMAENLIDTYNMSNENGNSHSLGGASDKNNYEFSYHVHQNEHGGGYVDCLTVKLDSSCFPLEIKSSGFSCQ